MMSYNSYFFINSAFLGIALAMDAFSVSIADGLTLEKIHKKDVISIAGIFSLFQFLMPLLGYFLVHFLADKFKQFSIIIPYIAFILLLFLGIKAIIEGISNLKQKNNEGLNKVQKIGFSTLLLQAIATSIDALSTGFTISDYDYFGAFLCSLIIAIITFLLCSLGLILGKALNKILSKIAPFIGGTILIIIGLEILIESLM